MRNTIRVDISATRHLGHRGCICGIGENDALNRLPHICFGKTKPFSPIVEALSTMTVKKDGLGLMNTVTASRKKYLSYQRGSAELILTALGGGALSNANHDLALE